MITAAGVSASAGAQGTSAGPTGSVSISSAPYAAFEVRFGRREPIHCRELEGSTSEGWFHCSTDDPSTLAFRQGEGARCSSDLVGPDAHATQTTLDCWRGAATIDGFTYGLERGVVTNLGVPANSITWVDPNGHAVLAAELISTPAFYDTRTPATHALRERLVALTFALLYHEAARRAAR